MKTFDKIYEINFVTEEDNLRENQQLIESERLLGMSVLRKFETGLPVNIWVDDGNTYKLSGHTRRIKIQPDKGDHPNSRIMIPMSISDDPQIMVKNYYCPLSEYDLNLVKKFVKINKELLLKVGSIGILEFGNQMKKVEG